MNKKCPDMFLFYFRRTFGSLKYLGCDNKTVDVLYH